VATSQARASDYRADAAEARSRVTALEAALKEQRWVAAVQAAQIHNVMRAVLDVAVGPEAGAGRAPAAGSLRPRAAGAPSAAGRGDGAGTGIGGRPRYWPTDYEGGPWAAMNGRPVAGGGRTGTRGSARGDPHAIFYRVGGDSSGGNARGGPKLSPFGASPSASPARENAAPEHEHGGAPSRAVAAGVSAAQAASAALLRLVGDNPAAQLLMAVADM
jgi:hypothetical protein